MKIAVVLLATALTFAGAFAGADHPKSSKSKSSAMPESSTDCDTVHIVTQNGKKHIEYDIDYHYSGPWKDPRDNAQANDHYAQCLNGDVRSIRFSRGSGKKFKVKIHRPLPLTCREPFAKPFPTSDVVEHDTGDANTVVCTYKVDIKRAEDRDWLDPHIIINIPGVDHDHDKHKHKGKSKGSKQD